MTTTTTEPRKVLTQEEHAAERAKWIADHGLPASVRVRDQKKTLRSAAYRLTEKGALHRMKATIRWDDQCGNGVNSFSVTGETEEFFRGSWCEGSCGCVHEDFVAAFPKLAHLIRWHLMMADGPMHYLANVIYHAGDRDHWGLKKGEFRQHTSRGPHQADGVPGVPHWELRDPERKTVYAAEKPAPVVLEWQPSGITGEGKARELEFARSGAVWPEITDAELIALADGPRAEFERVLMARAPVLQLAFKADVEALGFTY